MLASSISPSPDLLQTLYTDNREEKVELINAVTLEKSDGLHQLSQVKIRLDQNLNFLLDLWAAFLCTESFDLMGRSRWHFSDRKSRWDQEANRGERGWRCSGSHKEHVSHPTCWEPGTVQHYCHQLFVNYHLNLISSHHRHHYLG